MSVPVEPSADIRDLAHNLRQIFVALREQGFTDAQGCAIVGTMLGQAISSGQGESE